MAVTAPIEGEMQQDTITVDAAVDDIVIVPDDLKTEVAPTPGGGTTHHTDPVMLFVYLGILTLLAIIATSAVLAL